MFYLEFRNNQIASIEMISKDSVSNQIENELTLAKATCKLI